MTLTARAQQRLFVLTEAEKEASLLLSANAARMGEISRAFQNNPNSEDAPNLEHEYSRLTARQTELQQKANRMATLRSRIGLWINRLGEQAVIDVKLPTPETRSNESSLTAVNRIRDDIRKLMEERAPLLNAGLSKAHLREEARKFAMQAAERGTPIVRADHESGLSFSFASESFDRNVKPHEIAAFMDPDGFAKALIRLIDAQPETKGRLTLSPAERAKRLAEIDERILLTERDEVQLIEGAAMEGMTILPRADTAPLAFLGLALKKKVVRAAA